MFCSKCGTKNNDDAKFCSSCGAAIAGASEAPQVMQDAVENLSSDAASNTGASSGGSLKVGPLEIFIAALVVVGLIYFKLSDSSKEASPTSPPAPAPVTFNAGTAATLVVRKNLRSPSSFQHVRSDVLWKGKSADGKPAYVVAVGYDAQNAFGAMLRGCMLVAFYEAGNDEIGWNPTYGAQEASAQLCDPSTPKNFKDGEASVLVNLNRFALASGATPAAPTKAQPAAAPAEVIPVAAQIEKQKKLFVARACPSEEKAESEERTTQHGDVAANSGEKYVFVHILCGRSSHALAMIYNGKTIARGREFLNILGGEGKYTAETGKLTYSAPFAADGDARCCPSGVGAVVLDAAKLEMVFRKIKPQGEDERVPSRDVTLP